jgi:clan AA aspartic protease (TIGR02281 family)
MRCPLACLLLLALSACAGQTVADCQSVRIADVPFTIEHGYLIVDVSLNGQPARLAFDTGSATSVLTRAAADRLHLRRLRSYDGDLVGIGGERPAGTVVADQFKIGDLHGSDFPFLRSEVFENEDNPPDGLLSADLMAKYDIDLDFPDHKIILYYQLSSCHGQAAVALDQPLFSVPLISPSSNEVRNPEPNEIVDEPTVMATVNGTSMPAVIDTGSDHTAIFRDTARRAGVNDPDLFDGNSDTVTGVGPHDVRVAVRHLAQIGVGDITIQNLPVTVLDQHRTNQDGMLLGLDFLARVHVWISHSSNTLVLQYPPLPSPRAVGSP